MPTNRKVIDFKIHNLTEEQFQELKEAGQIDPNAIYCTPDETVANFEAVNARIDAVDEEIEALKDKGGFPLLTAMWADHTLNDMSWLNADTFSWQSGDVYVAAYEHLVADFEAVTSFVQNGTTYYAWLTVGTGTDRKIYYTTQRTPSVGMDIYTRSYDGTVSKTDLFCYSVVSDNKITLSNNDSVVYSPVFQETINDITISYFLAQDGHKICLASKEADVQALYEKTGVAWYYILDTANKQFKLPRTKFGFTGLRDSVGGYVEAGVPNIYGYMTNILSDGYDNSSKTQALTAKTESTNFYTPQSSGYGLRAESWTFDASNSNSIYGNSGTVQPPATQMYLYFYVGNFERDALEQTAGITSEQLNNKADRDFNNTDIYDYVIAEQKPTASNNYTWFRKYKSGWVEQGGRAVIYDGSAEPNRYDAKDISIPVPMKHCTNWHCQARHDRFNAGIGQDNITTTAHIYQVNDSTNTFVNQFVIWEISGYAA